MAISRSHSASEISLLSFESLAVVPLLLGSWFLGGGGGGSGLLLPGKLRAEPAKRKHNALYHIGK